MIRLNTSKIVLVLGAALALVAGCSCETTPVMPDAPMTDTPRPDTGGTDVPMVDAPAPMAALAVTPALQDFGDIVLGETSSAIMFTFANSGTGPTAPLTVSLAGPDRGLFDITMNACTGPIAAMGECQVEVTFSPTAVGSATAMLTGTAGTLTATATLEGNGVDAGLSISPTPRNFGSTSIGVATAATTFTVRNTGDATSGTIAISIGGIDPTQFDLDPAMDMCTGMTLAPMATCTVQVTYNPSAEGAHSATLDASASPGSTTSAALSGTATRPAGLILLPANQDFGSIVTGMSSPTAIDFTLRNTGGVATGTISHTFGAPDGAEFSVVTSGCAGAPLPAGMSCTISVRFNAGAVGAKMSSLNVTDGTLNASSILTATSISTSALRISPPTQGFGSSPIGVATGATTFTVTNPGGAPTGTLSAVVAGANPADFPPVSGGDGCTGTILPPGGTCTIAVAFNPTVSGVRRADLRVTGTPGGSVTATLDGTGVSAAMLDLSPANALFGDVGVGATSSQVSFTVTNLGGSPSGIPGLALGGGLDALQFNIDSNGCTSALAPAGSPGDSCLVVLSFRPTSTGAKVATLTVTGAPGGSDVSNLGGTGITAGALSLAPTTLDFGDVAETDSDIASVIVSNMGAAPISGLTSMIGTPGADGATFAILPSSTCGATLAGGSNCQLDLRFTPSRQGAHAATLTVASTAPALSRATALQGNGIPDLAITGPSFVFGDTFIGVAVTRTYTVTNQTTRTLTGITVSNPPTTGADFVRLASGTCGTTVTMLAPAATCTIAVRFTPSGAATGASPNRTSPVTVSGSGGATETATLTGNAVGPVIFQNWQLLPVGGVTALPAAFGNVPVGTVANLRLNVTNLSTATQAPIMTSSTFSPNDMNIVADTCSGVALGSMASCRIDIRYYPRGTPPIPASGTITLNYGANTTATTLTGTGIAGAAVNVTGSAAFGTVIPNNTADRTITVTNTSPSAATAPINIALFGSVRFTDVSAGAGRCISGNSLPASGSCTVTLRYSPQLGDSRTVASTATLAVTSTTPVTGGTVAVSGTAGQQLVLTPSTLSFTAGSGSTSPAQRVTVRNASTVATGSIVVTVPGFTVFPVGPFNDCTTLAPGATCSFDVAFSPTSSADDYTGVELRVSNGAFGSDARSAVALMSSTAASLAALEIRPPTLPGVSPGFGSRFFFGTTLEGSNTISVAFEVTNTGELPTAMPITSLLDDNACVMGGQTVCTATASFDITGTTCSSTMPLAGGASCNVSIRYSPIAGSAMGFAINHPGSLLVNGGGAATARAWVLGQSLAAASLTVSPGIDDFGSVGGGSTVGPRTYTVTNSTAGAIVLDTPAVFSFTGSTHWIINNSGAGACTNGLTMGVGATCTFTLTYAPPIGGPFGRESDFIIIDSNLPLVAAVSVIGTSIAPAALDLLPSGTVNFPVTGVGLTSSQAFTLTNTGDLPTTSVPAIVIGGVDFTEFAVASNTCTAVLAGGASCTFAVEFRPLGAGLRNANVTVSATSGSGPLTDSTLLFGISVAAPSLGLNPLGNQPCTGAASRWAGTDTYPCITYNVANGSVTDASPLTISLGAMDDFAVTGGTCGGALPGLTICTIEVSHRPDDVGVDTGTLTVSAPGSPPAVGTFNTTAILPMELTSGSPAFGSTSITGMGVSRTFVITNRANPATGLLTYSVTGANGADFDVTSDTCTASTLASGGMCSITVNFLPSSATPPARAGILTVTDGTPNHTLAISMSGTGTAP